MKLRMNDAIVLQNALAAIDSRNDIITEDGGKQRQVSRPCSFAAGTRMKIARNLRALTTLIGDFHEERNALIRSLASGANEVPADKLAEFGKQSQELLEQDHDLELQEVSEADLNIDQNQISSATLAVLLLIVKDGASGAAAAAPVPAEEPKAA